MKTSTKNVDRLLDIFNNYHGQEDKILNLLSSECLELILVELLSIINNLIKEDKLVCNINSVNNILDYIYQKMLNENIDKEIINRKLTKILESINTVLIDEKYEPSKKKEYRTTYYHLSRKIMKFPIDENEDRKYIRVLWLIITKTKNIDYINKTLEVINNNNINNMVFKDSHTIIMELIILYTKNINNIKNSLEDVKYYNSVIKLILFNKYFNISEVEKEWCINFLSKEKEVLNKKEIEKIKYIDDILCSFNTNFDNIKELNDLSNRYNIDIFDSNFYIGECNIDTHLSNRVIANDYIISIDNIETKEIDDCLSCKKLEDGSYLLGIHIADVFGYIDMFSGIMEDALSRG